MEWDDLFKKLPPKLQDELRKVHVEDFDTFYAITKSHTTFFKSLNETYQELLKSKREEWEEYKEKIKKRKNSDGDSIDAHHIKKSNVQIANKGGRNTNSNGAESVALQRIKDKQKALEKMHVAIPDLSNSKNLEAVIEFMNHPAYIIHNGTFTLPTIAPRYEQVLKENKEKINAVIPSVGCIYVSDDDNHFGSVWVIQENICVTTKHTFGKNIKHAQIDFKQEVGSETNIFKVNRVCVSKTEDIAFIELNTEEKACPQPIPFDETPPSSGTVVVALGYPAKPEDVDVSQAQTARDIFQSIWRKKRLQPGSVFDYEDVNGPIFHNCSTLHGNSGCLLLNPVTGKAVGMHQGGEWKKHNWAVNMKKVMVELKKYLDDELELVYTSSVYEPFLLKVSVFLYTDIDESTKRTLTDIIIRYAGNLTSDIETATHIITNTWSQQFDSAIAINDKLLVLKPGWVKQCEKTGQKVPHQKYHVTE